MFTDLRHRGRKHNDFIEFTNSLHELIDTRALDHIDIVIVTLNLDWDREISLVQNLEEQHVSREQVSAYLR